MLSGLRCNWTALDREGGIYENQTTGSMCEVGTIPLARSRERVPEGRERVGWRYASKQSVRKHVAVYRQNPPTCRRHTLSRPCGAPSPASGRGDKVPLPNSKGGQRPQGSICAGISVCARGACTIALGAMVEFQLRRVWGLLLKVGFDLPEDRLSTARALAGAAGVRCLSSVVRLFGLRKMDAGLREMVVDLLRVNVHLRKLKKLISCTWTSISGRGRLISRSGKPIFWEMAGDLLRRDGDLPGLAGGLPRLAGELLRGGGRARGGGA
jgi:hypothetical protein